MQKSEGGLLIEAETSAEKRRLFFTVFIAVSFLILLFLWIFSVAEYDIKKMIGVVISPKTMEFLTATIVSLITGVFSAYVYSRVGDSDAKKDLLAITSSGPKELVFEALALIRDNQNKLLYDQDTIFTLRRQGQEGFLRLTVQFKYKKITQNQRLDFHIPRLKSKQARDRFYKDENTAQFDSMYRSSELFYPIDEVALRSEFGSSVIEKAFEFKYIKVDGQQVALLSAVGTNDIKTYPLMLSRDTSIPINIEYSFEFAVSENDIQYCTIEFPTRGATIKLIRDRSIQGQISADAYEMMSVTRGTAVVSEVGKGTHEVTHNGWILPKSSAVFHWYPSSPGGTQ